MGPLSCSFQCHVHFAIVYTPGLVGCLVCTVSFACSWFTCIRATYTGVFFSWDAYDHASNAVVATCGSRAGDRCCLLQLCVICRRNTLMSTWRQVYWPLHARFERGVACFSCALFAGVIHWYSTWRQIYWPLHGVTYYVCLTYCVRVSVDIGWCDIICLLDASQVVSARDMVRLAQCVCTMSAVIRCIH